MKLKVRYEDELQTIELNAETMDEFCVSLSLEVDKDIPEKEKETMIQNAFDKYFNKPEYNNWHKFDRHRGNLKKPFRKDDDNADESDGLDTVGDFSQEEERNRKYDYETLCQQIRSVLKPDYAEVIVAILIDEKTPEEFAAEKGLSKDAVYKRLQRAKKKIKKFL